MKVGSIESLVLLYFSVVMETFLVGIPLDGAKRYRRPSVIAGKPNDDIVY